MVDYRVKKEKENLKKSLKKRKKKNPRHIRENLIEFPRINEISSLVAEQKWYTNYEQKVTYKRKETINILGETNRKKIH